MTPERELEFEASQEAYYKLPTLLTPQHLTLMCVEIHVNTRGELRPDPSSDAVQCICYAVHDDTIMQLYNSKLSTHSTIPTPRYRYHLGVLLLMPEVSPSNSFLQSCASLLCACFLICC